MHPTQTSPRYKAILPGLLALGAMLAVSSSAAAQTTYKDPGGHFTIAVPAGWHAETRPGSPQVLISKDQGHVEVSMVVMPSQDGSTPDARYTLDYYVKATAQHCTNPQFKAQDKNDDINGLPALLTVFVCDDPDNGQSIKLFKVATTNGKILVFIQEGAFNDFMSVTSAINSITGSLHLMGDVAASAGSKDAGPPAKGSAAAKSSSARQAQPATSTRAKNNDVQPYGSVASNVYRDPRGLFSLTIPDGWTTLPQGNDGDGGVVVAQTETGLTMVYFDQYNGGRQPNDIVADYENQFRKQLQNFSVGRHGDMNFNGYAAASAVCYGTNSQGVPLTLVIVGVAGPNGRAYRMISRVPRSEEQAQNPTFFAIMQSVKLATEAPAPAPASPWSSNANSSNRNGSAVASKNGSMQNVQLASAKVSGWDTYQDPVEQAFTVEVPKGWTVKGGLFRVGYSDRRAMMDLTSPDGEINIRVGDVVIPPFFLPSQGHPEGQPYPLGAQAQPMVARFRTGQQLAEFYGKARFRNLCDSLKPQQAPAPADQPKNIFEQKIMQVEGTNNGGAQTTVGQVSYACNSAIGPRTAVAFAQTHMSGNTAVWMAETDSYVAPDDRMALAQSVLEHLENSIQFSTQWAQYDRQEDQQGLEYQKMRQQQRRADIYAQVQQFEQQMQGMRNQVAAFERGQAQRNSQFQAFDNALIGVTPTVDAFGVEHDVSTGPHYNYYINPGTGQKVNANSSPGPGWQQLTVIPQN